MILLLAQTARAHSRRSLPKILPRQSARPFALTSPPYFPRKTSLGDEVASRRPILLSAPVRPFASLTTAPPTLTLHEARLTLANLSIDDPSPNPTDVPFVWLRDSCPCPRCVHPSTSQKMHRTTDVPLDIKPKRAEWVMDSGEWALEVEWDRPIYHHDTTSSGVVGHAVPTPDQHVSRYSTSFLRLHSSQALLDNYHHSPALKKRTWLRDDLMKQPNLVLSDAHLRGSDEGMLRALTQLAQYGVVVIKDVPTTIPEDEKGDWEVKKVAGMLSHIRQNFYGDLWSVRSVPTSQSKNVAFTDLDLDFHMDLLYFETPPRFQMLHCLRNRNVDGGQSVLVDAFKAAETLREEDADAFNILTTTDVGYWYVNDGHHLERKHKTIIVDPHTSRILEVNYGPPFQSPLPISTPAAFYPAFQKFAALLRRPEARWEFLLNEGDLVVFDNRRLLHARRAFTERVGPEGPSDVPNRWLRGCYLETDAILDRIRVLRASLGYWK